MYLNVGNDNAIEGYRDSTSDDPELVRYRPVEGQRITNIVFPEGTSIAGAFTTALGALEHHLAKDSPPAWVESDSEGLKTLVMEHYGLSKSKGKQPKNWGSEQTRNFQTSVQETHEEG